MVARRQGSRGIERDRPADLRVWALMIPLRDDNPTEMFPVITVGIIVACVAVWIQVQGAGFDQEALAGSVCSLGAIPAEITGSPGERTISLGGTFRCGLGGLTWEAMFTSMFLHGSWMHLIGNMWFLWIFGNNVEDSMGHLRFLAFYVLAGLAAAGAHVLADPSSAIPVVGASGAISAIMGAYLVLYPRARVKTLVFVIFLITVVSLPAWIYLGYWFLLQLVSSAAQPAEATGGIAFWAHIGGFVAGVVLVWIFRRTDLVEAKRAHVKLPRDQIRHGGWW